MSTISELLQLHRDDIFKRLHVAVPARVMKYDDMEGTVDCKPLVKEQEINPETEDPQHVSQPVIFRCPLVFPGAGLFRITFPVQVGDTVLLVFADKSIDEWMQVGDETTTIEERRHHHTDAIAIVGLNDLKHAWTGAHKAFLTIGKDGGVQTEYTGDEIHLGLDAVEQFILGTTYRNAEHAENQSLASQITQMGTSFTQMATLFTSQAAVSVGTLSPLQAGFTALAAAATALAAAATAAAAAINQFEAKATQYLSDVVKGT